MFDDKTESTLDYDCIIVEYDDNRKKSTLGYCVDDRETPSIHRPTFVFVSGLRWQLSGLSELPLKQRLLLLLACESSFFIMF